MEKSGVIIKIPPEGRKRSWRRRCLCSSRRIIDCKCSYDDSYLFNEIL
jgi:hypothetical protein